MKPMDSIDLKNRKPRRFKGTPAYKLRNYITAAFVAYTLITGAAYMFSPINRNIWTVSEVLSRAKQHELAEATPEDNLKNNLMFQAYTSASERKQLDNKTESALGQ